MGDYQFLILFLIILVLFFASFAYIKMYILKWQNQTMNEILYLNREVQKDKECIKKMYKIFIKILDEAERQANEKDG